MIDLLKEIHSQTVEGEFPPSSRVLAYFLAMEHNAHFWTRDGLAYSERELVRLTGLKKSTLHDAIKFLSDKGVIKTWSPKSKTKTYFKFLSKNVPEPCRPPTDQSPTTNRPPTDQSPTTLPVSNYAHAKDLKTEDDKTLKTAATGARGKNLITANSVEVLQAWENANTPTLKGNIALMLIQLEREFGTQNLVDAIKAADLANKNPVLSFNFVKKVLDNRMKGAIPQNGRNQSVGTHSQPVAEDWESKRPNWLES